MALLVSAEPLFLLVKDSHGPQTQTARGTLRSGGGCECPGWAGDSKGRPDLSIGSATEQLSHLGQLN